MPLFTVFTPTYNRAYILSELYNSLCRQTCMDFEWLIVDDGSSDDTETLVQSWSSSNIEFSIKYYKKENGGKPRAINYGIKFASGKYFFMVDSDDMLQPDAIAKLAEWIKDIDREPAFIGVGAAKGYSMTEYIKGVPPTVNSDGYIDATNLERRLYNMDADMCEAYKTEIFRKFPMAEWPGELFAPEQIALNEIALAGYKLRWHKDIIYICDYHDDGLTKGSKKLEKNNPMGYAMMYNHMLRYGYTFKKNLFFAAQLTALSIYGKKPSYIFKTNNVLATIFTFPIGLILSIRRKIQFSKV